MPDTAVAAPGVQEALALGLTAGEYQLILDKLGRTPTQVELACFSLLWSEHCAYKHSKKLLRTLPTEGAALVMGPGENAGAVDIGEGLTCAFKVESHNHPSAVEPFQGAATGVGGILRDVFAVGARPIAILDSLRFGEPGERTRYLLDRAVAGIGHYGNSIGVATVGGEVYFEGPYEQNCLVNAMCLGLAPREQLIRAAAAGPGNALILFGASTGRDGIGGASVLASAELGEDDAHKRPSVQIGDPFEEKKLLECSLELLHRGLLVSLQDLGAAGLTSSAAEMASKGAVGVDIHVDRVPLREPDLEPFEIMVSESQERMLCVALPERVSEVLAVCERWETRATVIGEVTEGGAEGEGGAGRMRVLSGDEVVGDMPVAALVDDCPLYDLVPVEPTEALYPPPPRVLESEDPGEVLLALLASPNLASRRPLFEQYDCLVGSRTVREPEQADAAVLAIRPAGVSDEPPGGGRGVLQDGFGGDGGAPVPAIAVSLDANGRRVACDPYRGTVATVLECAANLACVGAEPLGLTNCLNFGNPEKPAIAWQLTESVRGLGDACRALEVPVVGGNVSLYNEGAEGPIYPTPVVGMVGSLPDARRAGRLGFAREGDEVAIVGPFAPDLHGSELAKLGGGELPRRLADIDVEAVRAALGVVRDAVRSGSLSSAHDIAEGGVAVALAECALASGLGARAALDAELLTPGHDKPLGVLFGEGSGGFVVSGPAAALEALGGPGEGGGDGGSGGSGVRVLRIGTVGGVGLQVAVGKDVVVDVTLAQLREASTALAALF